MDNSIKPLFIFELANNHMGDPDHGLRIIREINEATRAFRDEFSLAVKFQYRDLDTFIHPSCRDSQQHKYVKRFLETRISEQQFLTLKQELDRLGFIAVCTPFDEVSVGKIEAHGIGIIKIASCSLTDWPLLERIALAKKPIIASTAGSSLEDIDRVVSFFLHRGKQLSLMHCVAEYPTPDANLQLNQIDLLKTRYPQVSVGFSTHENPDSVQGIQLAVAKGAAIFEKHVGVPTERYPLNAYSANPQQVTRWLEAAREAFSLGGVSGRRMSFSEKELTSLRELRRGAWTRAAVPAGRRITPDMLMLAIPTQPGQLTANDLAKYVEYYAKNDLPAGSPVLAENITRNDKQESIRQIVSQIRSLIRTSGVHVPQTLDLEISHHYGVDQFAKFGLTMVSFINREYCKKLLLLLPGQQHPEQYHKQKEETFQVLYGEVELELDGKKQLCRPADIITVERGVKHAFSSATGAVIEEISSSHFVEDSYYSDPAIANNTSRKTLITYWLD